MFVVRKEEDMYDAIVVGARCAGSPTAMLLARKGYRVLLVDRAGFPSDALSTHYIHQPGAATLNRWGILDRVIESGCPPIEKQVLDVGPFALVGAPPPADGIKAGYAPRRKVLDKILLDAAIESGVEFREHFSVEELLTHGGRVTGIRGRSKTGAAAEDRAYFVIGADGIHSVVARLVEAPRYNEQPAFNCTYYTYWSDVNAPTVEMYMRPERMIIGGPTNDGLTLTIVYWPEIDFARIRANVEREFMRAIDLIPEFSARIRSGTRVEKFRGSGDLRGFFRRPYGPGWALVGDAAYHKNPITAAGITDAFRDAELLADAVDDTLEGFVPAELAMAEYERKRNETALPLYRMTCEMAKLEPPVPEMQNLFSALRENEKESGRFLGTVAGTVPISEFYSPSNLQRITGMTIN